MAPKLFIFSAGAGGASAKLETSLGHGFAEGLPRAFIDSGHIVGRLPEGRLHAWGAKPAPGNAKAWAALRPGDIGLAYANGRFVAAGRLTGKAYAPELASQLWGLDPEDERALMYFLDQIEQLDLGREEVAGAFGYGARFSPAGLMVPAEGRQIQVASTGSVERAVREALRTRPPAPAALARELPPPPQSPGTTEPEPLPDAYARIDAPPSVVAGREFEVVAGLSDTPQSEVGGDKQIPRPDDATEYELCIAIVAAGFTLRDGETWSEQVTVTADDPFPTITRHLTPDAQEEPVRGGLIQVLYSIGGETIGLAVRAVGVAREETLREGAEEPAQDPSFGLSRPAPDSLPADVTVRILAGDRDRELIWTAETAWEGLDAGECAPVDVGSRPEEYAKDIVEGVSLRTTRSDLGLYLTNIGRTVGDHVPAGFWELLREIHRRKGSRPTVLILSRDTYVPWELAHMPEPLLDPATKPWLAAQAVVGRWPLAAKGRPPASPPREVAFGDVAVVSGTYKPPLTEAAAEATELVATYGAKKVPAAAAPLSQLLELGGGGASVLHFAVHGRYDPGTPRNGLFLTDDTVLEPEVVKGADLKGAPFVFLNACQVGSAAEVLGDYGGMAAAFLYAGASGVVAPLWSVDDAVARQLALAFYDRTLADVPPAEYLREQRAADVPWAISRTHLAYQFYGHPAYRLIRA